jgi:glutathione peroxidase
MTNLASKSSASAHQSKNQEKDQEKDWAINGESDFINELMQIPLATLDHKSFLLALQKTKVLLFVNTASQCGYTPQYKGLQQLYDQYKEQEVLVIGVPCNQFGAQEPGTEKEIQSFCETNFGVQFPVLQKADVKGLNQHPLFKFLIEKALTHEEIKWNFEKFLVVPATGFVQRFKSADLPEKISESIAAALQAKV